MNVWEWLSVIALGFIIWSAVGFYAFSFYARSGWEANFAVEITLGILAGPIVWWFMLSLPPLTDETEKNKVDRQDD